MKKIEAMTNKRVGKAIKQAYMLNDCTKCILKEMCANTKKSSANCAKEVLQYLIETYATEEDNEEDNIKSKEE